MKKIVAFLLTLCFLLFTVVPAFALDGSSAPLQSQASMEELLDAFETHDTEKLKDYIDYFAQADESEAVENPKEVSNPEISLFWESGGAQGNDEQKACHQNLTFYGFLLLISDMQRLFSATRYGFTIADLNTLIDFCHKPDHGTEADLFTYVGHFYNPATGANYFGNASPSAKTRLVDHYYEAVKSYNNGNRTVAMQELGMALHYVQDSSEPHHASDLISASIKIGNGIPSNHSDFERAATQFLLTQLESDQFTFPELEQSSYVGYQNRLPGDTIHELASAARGLKAAAAYEGDNEISYWNLAAFFSLPLAMSGTAGILYRFAREVHMI